MVSVGLKDSEKSEIFGAFIMSLIWSFGACLETLEERKIFSLKLNDLINKKKKTS
jgi:hypothetical protein